MLARLAGVEIPAYLGCDWENVPLHLPSTFAAWKALGGNPSVRIGLLGSHGLTWPWESLHVEALAWFDHWLKDADTGIMDGPPIRYWMPGCRRVPRGRRVAAAGGAPPRARVARGRRPRRPRRAIRAGASTSRSRTRSIARRERSTRDSRRC